VLRHFERSKLQGNAALITLLPKADKNMESNKEYIVELFENGTIFDS
jgi:hypothetical protein